MDFLMVDEYDLACNCYDSMFHVKAILCDIFFFTTLEEAQESADNKGWEQIYKIHDNIEYNDKLDTND